MYSSKVHFYIFKSSLLLLILPALFGLNNAQDAAEERRMNDPTAETVEEAGSLFSDMWLEGSDMVRALWKECSKKVFEKESKISKDILPVVWQCVKKKTLKALDRTLSADIIPLAQGVELVRYQQFNKKGKLVKPHENVNYYNNETDSLSKDAPEWRYAVLEKMVKVFNTHVLKVDIAQEDKMGVVEPRHRRRNQMMQMMMFGIMSMGMILVPMGFQFLAVLGGKALLLAKFALILSSIQALKKASTSSVAYPYSPVAQISPEHAFEKRGYDTPGSETDLKTTEMEGVQQPYQIVEATENNGNIAYRFDRNSQVWKPQQNNVMVKKPENNAQKVYPVYSVSQSHSNSNDDAYVQNEEMRPVYSGFQPVINNMIKENYKAQPTEIQAEYTIDLPIDKVQLKTTSPFITNTN